MRVLGRIRLSRLTEESTSPQRQREIIETWAEQNDHTVVGWAEDLDVSGAVDPFDTPALGPWLTDKLGEWDILCAWKLDRLARRAVPLHRLFGLCHDEQKTLVCVSDSIDLSTWVGRLVASVIAGVAEGELEAIRERTKASQQKLRELGRWPGGRPSYGYKAVERQDAAGWELVIDDEAALVMRGIVDDVLGGKAVELIARELTSAGVLPPSEHLRKRAGEPFKPGKWSGQSIRQLLRSKTMLGHVTHQGNTVRDSDGQPIKKGLPLINQDEFDRIQTILESRSFKKTRSTKASPLLGVVVCPVCDGLLYQNSQTVKGKLYRYYLCKSCRSASVPAETAESLAEEAFLDAAGDLKVTEKVFIPGENHQIELDEAMRAVDELSKLLGTITSTTMSNRLTEQMRALDSRITTLEKLPSSEARWEYVETAKTYAEAWNDADTEQQRQLLLSSGITATIKRIPKTQAVEFHLRVPDNIVSRLNAKKIPLK